jgi:RPM1-interacting protein 4
LLHYKLKGLQISPDSKLYQTLTCILYLNYMIVHGQPARGGALPKFGAWDAKDPNAGDGFTMIFQKASVEKKEGGPVRIPQMSNELLPGSLEDPHQNQSSAQSKRPSQSRSNVSSHHN